MSPRSLLSAALRHCRSCLPQQQTATLTTTSKAQAFKPIANPNAPAAPRFPSTSATGSILGLDSDAASTGGGGTGPGSNATNLALRYAEIDRKLHVQRRQARQEEVAQRLADQATSDGYMRAMPRRWRVGDVYAPKDIGPAEARRWRRAKHVGDVVDEFQFNPLDNYQNFSIISEFMTSTGRIMHSKETGLRPVNQRKMAKAIRRAIGLGIHPSVHRHPEILKWQNSPYAVKARSSKPTPAGDSAGKS